MTATQQTTTPSTPRMTSGRTLTPFQSLAMPAVKGFVRDKATLFFTLLFPLMFLVIFGLIFGNQGTSKVTIGVVGDGPISQTLAKLEAVELKRIDTVDLATEQVKAGDLPAYVVDNGTAVTRTSFWRQPRLRISRSNRSSTSPRASCPGPCRSPRCSGRR